MVELYRICDRGMSGVVFPDGGAPLDQPLALIDAWQVIGYGLHINKKQG